MWNLLTRTSQSFEFVNLKLTTIWILGFFVRYCILLPGRICILFVGVSNLHISCVHLNISKNAEIFFGRGNLKFGDRDCAIIYTVFQNCELNKTKPTHILYLLWLVLNYFFFLLKLPRHFLIILIPIMFLKLTYLMAISVVLSLIPNMLSRIKQPIYEWAALTCFRILARSFSGVIRFHNEKFRPNSDGICVANHTTPIDVVVLSCDRSYALVTCNFFWKKKIQCNSKLLLKISFLFRFFCVLLFWKM